jgi:hypothetical protein
MSPSYEIQVANSTGAGFRGNLKSCDIKYEWRSEGRNMVVLKTGNREMIT